MDNGILKLTTFENLDKISSDFRGRKIVHCHGVFDVVHYGHLVHFKSAKKYGEILVVTVTADKFVNKGPGRPYFNENLRAQMIAALDIVDRVAISPYPTAIPAIIKLKPDFYVKGPDYKNKSSDLTGAIFDEERAVNEIGGKLVFTEDPTYSSSSIINKFFSPWNEAQQKTIQDVKNSGGIDVIEEVLEKISHESICVVGEPIVDTYVYCFPEALSSKSPSISARFLYDENYAGGTLAIANNLSTFVAETNLLISHGGEDYFSTLLKEKMNHTVQIYEYPLINTPTARKTRFIDANSAQRFFEITNLNADQWLRNNPDDFCKHLMLMDNSRTSFIIADFGHGMFEGQVLRSLTDLRGFVALNVQTNSSNIGFNFFTKHKRFDFLSMDTREARLAMRDRYTSITDLARVISKKINSYSGLALTVGGGGSYYFPRASESEYYAPAFADKIVDTIGAGDAFLGLTSLLVKHNCQNEIILFLGNVFAGLKTSIMGNKSAVTKAQFLKTVNAILK